MADQAPPDVATYRVLLGDAQEQLHPLTDASINLCVTSPPYSDLISYDGAPLPTAPVYVAWLLLFDDKNYQDWRTDLSRF